MATYTIVSSTTDPLGPGEIAAGSPILVSPGDVFIIDPTADAKITFQADGGIPADFGVVINDSNANIFEISVLSNLTPTVTIADNVDASGIKLGAASSDAVNFTAGNNVQFGEYLGSTTGADTISIGNGFTTTKKWTTSGGDDSITVGNDATFSDLDGGSGNDTISLGDGATLGKIQGGAGDDSITLGLNASVTSVDGEGGNDTLTTETGGLIVSNVETVNLVHSAHISEVSYAAADSTDFVEIRVDAGTDMSGYSLLVYDHGGSIRFTNTFSAPDATMSGSDVYVIDSTDPGGLDLRDNRAVALVDEHGNVVQFVTFEGNTVTAIEGAANGMTADSIGTSANGNSLQSDDGGVTYYEQTAPNAGTVPCYAPGTMIDTPNGPRAVEKLRAGDLVSTVDHGAQPIRWIRGGDRPLEQVEIDGAPVLIAAGALGEGLPDKDLIVSPQHRILVGGHRQLQGRFETEMFAPAKSLTELKGVRSMRGKTRIDWVHFACDRHEVVIANGCLSESLLLGPMVINALTPLERRTVLNIFGPATTPDAPLNGPPARNCLTVGDARRKLANNPEMKRKAAENEIRQWDADLAMERYPVETTQEAKVRNRSGIGTAA